MLPGLRETAPDPVAAPRNKAGQNPRYLEDARVSGDHRKRRQYCKLLVLPPLVQELPVLLEAATLQCNVACTLITLLQSVMPTDLRPLTKPR